MFVGFSNQTACEECPPGYYCEGAANVYPDGLCAPGFWCAGGSSNQMPYDAGVLTNVSGTIMYVAFPDGDNSKL